MPTILTPQQIEATREAILEVAERLIAESGAGAVTMREISARLGISPMTPYHYFTDKAELLSNLRTRALCALARALEAAAQFDGTPIDRLLRVGKAYSGFAQTHHCRFALMFDAAAADDPRWATARVIAVFETRATEILGDALNATALKTSGLALWTATHGMVSLQSVRSCGATGDARSLEYMLRALMNGWGAARRAHRQF